MRKFYLLFVLISSFSYGQTEEEKKQIEIDAAILSEHEVKAKKDLTELSEKFIEAQKIYEEEKTKLKEITNKIDANTTDVEKLTAQIKVTGEASKKVDDIYIKAQGYIMFYTDKGVDKDILVECFPHTHTVNVISEPESSEPPKIYYYFGENKVIAEDDSFFNNKVANDIFIDVLSRDSKAYLGDFVIPIKNQSLILYKLNYIEKAKKKERRNKRKANRIEKKAGIVTNMSEDIIIKSSFIDSSIKVKFKEVKVHILEGSVYDIQVFVLDSDNNELLFENEYPISLLRYTSIAPDNYLFYKSAISNNKKNALNMEGYKFLRLKLTDVLSYYPNPGDNYLPENLTLKFPAMLDDDKETNLNSAVKYKVNQNTALENMVELRTYTDFLGLFADSDNGLVQLEGKADFYINPFNESNSLRYYFKKISPFVNFSKLDEDSKYVELKMVNDSTSTIKTSLELLEKSYLEMGAKFTLFSWRIKKEYPFDINLYVPVRYQIADLKLIDGTTYNYKLLGAGGGLLFEFRRYNNFGFNLGFELVRNDMKVVNDIEAIINPPSFWTTRYDAEIYYFPGTTEKQSIFLRLKTYNNASKDNGESFYQLQFGYRFSIGVGKIKARS